MNNKNIIIGHAITTDLKEVSLFIATALQETNSDILLFVDNEDIFPSHILKTGRVILRKSIWRTLTKNQGWHGLVNCRFIEYHHVLTAILQNNYYSNVLLTDTRDVLFQSNPFDKLDGSFIYFALEESGVKLGSSSDLFGLSRFLSNEECEFLKQRPLICCGTIIGNSESVAHYLQIYVHIQRLFQEFRPDADDNAYDQGIANLVAHFHAIGAGLDMKLMECGEIIATVGMTLRLNKDKVSTVKNRIKYGPVVPAIIHQYDRLDDDCLKMLINCIWSENSYSPLLHLT